jgi:hypothetical protein
MTPQKSIPPLHRLRLGNLCVVFLFLFIATHSQAQINVEVFNKQWKIVFDFKQKLKAMSAEELAAYNQMTSAQKKLVENDLKEQANKSVFSFFTDNTFKVEMDSQETYSGTWRIGEDGKSIVVRTKEGVEERIFIKKLEPDILVLASALQGKDKEIVLVPKK